MRKQKAKNPSLTIKAVANDEAKILAAQLTKVEVTVKVRMGEEGRVLRIRYC